MCPKLFQHRDDIYASNVSIHFASRFRLANLKALARYEVPWSLLYTLPMFLVIGFMITSIGDLAFSDENSAKKPNIIFILCNDHRWDFLSSVGPPFVRTPHLDKLASLGILFSNAFVTISLCSPSRATFLTGQYAHTHGVQNNLTPWHDKNVTFMEIFKKTGYDTAFIGNWHVPGKLPKLRGVDLFVTFTVQGGQGRYWNFPLIVKGRLEPSGTPYITEELTNRAIEFISKNQENPFCLYLSHKAVHHQWSPPKDLEVIAKPLKISQRFRGTPFSVKRCSPAPSPKTSYFSIHYT